MMRGTMEDDGSIDWDEDTEYDRSESTSDQENRNTSEGLREKRELWP